MTCPPSRSTLKFGRQYPSITTRDGRTYLVDSSGLIIYRESVDPPCEQEIEAAARWLVKRIGIAGRTGTGRIGSYRLKHAAGRWSGTYVSNGAMIVAASREGYVLEVIDRICPVATPINCRVGVSQRHYHRLGEALMTDAEVMA